jgi:hypothetical protein
MSDKTLMVEPWGEGQGDFVLIDADSFDENFHTLFDDGTAQATPKEGTAAFIKAQLDLRGIAYKAGASKADLQALIDQADADVAALQLLVDTKAALTAKGITFEEAATQAELQTLLDAAA